MRIIGFLDYVFGRNKELSFMFDEEMYASKANRVHMKRLAISTCVSFLAKTISQSEFRVRDGQENIKDELYYRLNIKPNKNQTASSFWEKVIYKLIHDEEVLIIIADDNDLLIADDFQVTKYAVYEYIFSNVVVNEHEFKRTYKQSEVIHLKYCFTDLMPLIDSLFEDYGSLFSSMFGALKRKNQIRATVGVESKVSQTKDSQELFQKFINRTYSAIEDKDVAIIPEQNGFKYDEKASGSYTGGQTVDELNKVTNGFLDQVAMALGIPKVLLYGDMADVENQTKNYMLFTVNPLLRKISEDFTGKFYSMKEFLEGKRVEAIGLQYQSIFDLATSFDKLIASGGYTGNELRLEAGFEASDDPNLDKHYITKNYIEIGLNEGGDTENGKED